MLPLAGAVTECPYEQFPVDRVAHERWATQSDMIGGMMSLIGLEVGTIGCKAIVFDRRGRILGQEAREYPIAFPRPG